MTWSALDDLPADIRERASRVRLVALDVDGVLTDGRISFGVDGNERKSFHTLDGQGLKLLRSVGVEVAWITARSSAHVTRRAAELGIRHVHQKVDDKLAVLREICMTLDIKLEEVAYMGDDLPDLGPMQHVALSAAPANAHPWVRSRVHWRTQRNGGDGAVRELCDLILCAQRKAEAVLAQFLKP